MDDHELSFKLGELIINLNSLLEELILIGESNMYQPDKVVLMNDIVRLQFRIDNAKKQLKNIRKLK